MPNNTVLIIDDEDKIRTLLKRIISLEGYHVFDATTLGAASKILERESVDIVLCDVKLPDGNGVMYVKELKAKHPNTEVILLTAYGNIPDGVKAIKNGAFDYIVKGDDNDKMIPLISQAADKIALQRKVIRLEKQLNEKHGFDIIIGESPALTQAVSLAKKVAPTNAPVLLTGETGTGKEVFAEAIHYSSHNKENTFVALNCGAFSKELIESELFGHKAGSFTGATKDKKGLVEEAKNGTLFLDEIGEMPLDLQPKLLRFLENGTYYRVGETTERKAEIRLIAATNRDLQKEAESGKFRRDLYFRIAVFTIHLPALYERTKDIELLAKHFLKIYTVKANKQISEISPEAIRVLKQYNWPGNIRELKNVIERAVILEDSHILSISSLPSELQITTNTQGNTMSAFHLASVEKLHIQKVLNYTNGNKSEAARLLNIGLATLYRKLDEYKLK